MYPVYSVNYVRLAHGLYFSQDNGESFEQSLTGVGLITEGAATTLNTVAYVALSRLNGTYLHSHDGSAGGWKSLGFHPGVIVYDMEGFDNRLFAARPDGLWYLPMDPTEVSPDPGPLVPGSIVLKQNYPNPFNPSTTIEFSLERPGLVDLRVIDLLGRTVRQLINGHRAVGLHSILWDGRDSDGRLVASGTYFYRMIVGSEQVTKKMELVK